MQRRYRLRRTAVGALLLLILGLVSAKFVGGDDAPAGAAAPKVSATDTGVDRTAGVADPPAAAASSASPTTSARETQAAVDEVPITGNGTISVLAVPGADTGRTGATKTFSVEAEGGLGVDVAQFASSVRSILSDERGWESADKVHFTLVTAEQIKSGTAPDIRITLASPDLTDELCAPLNTMGEVSCNRNGRAVINAKRWVHGVRYYDNLDAYRTYLINHEVGHGLGHQHVGCPGAGRKAPIMVQQSLGLQGCTAWPYPTDG